MSRFISPPTSSSSSSPLDTISLPVGAKAIAENDLLVLTQGGNVRPLVSSNLIYENVDLSSGYATLLGATESSPAQLVNQFSQRISPRKYEQLSNGSFVMAYKGHNTGYPYYAIFNSAGQLVSSVEVDAASVSYGGAICALTTGGFVYVWKNASNNLSAVIYDNDGAVTTAEFDCNDTEVAYNTSFKIVASKANGNWAVLWSDDNNSDHMAVKIWDEDGAVVAAQFSPFSPDTGHTSTELLACADGDFVFFAATASSAGDGKIVRYSNTGTIVGSIVTLAGSASTNTSAINALYGDIMCELTDGKIAVLANENGTGYADIHIVPADFSGAGSHVSLGANFAVANCTMCAMPNAQVYVETHNGFNAILDNTATLVVDNKSSATNSVPMSVSYGMQRAKYVDGIGLVVAKTGQAGSSIAGGIRIYDTGRTALFAENEPLSGSNYLNGNCDPWVFITDDGTVHLGAEKNSGNAYYHNTVATAGSSVIGVAQAAAVANAASVEIATKGGFAINQTVTPDSFDRTAVDVIGTAGSIVGTTAILTGIS